MPKRYCAIADRFFAIKNNPVAPDEIAVSTAVETHGTLRETRRAARNAVWRPQARHSVSRDGQFPVTSATQGSVFGPLRAGAISAPPLARHPPYYPRARESGPFVLSTGFHVPTWRRAVPHPHADRSEVETA